VRKPLVINAPKRREQCLCGTFYANGTPTSECPVCTARISRIVAGEIRPTRAPIVRAIPKPFCPCGTMLSGNVRNTSGLCAICSTNHWATVNNARKRRFTKEEALALRAPLRLADKKKCPACGKTKNTLLFHLSRRRSDGLDSVCKACKAKRDKRVYYANRPTSA
jgi:hypothetical protein